MNNQIIYDKSKTIQVQQIISDWLNTGFFTHLFTVRTPISANTNNLSKAKRHFYCILKRYEKNLIGRHWYKKPLDFVALAELGLNKTWHFHLLVWGYKYTTEQLQDALDKTSDYMKLSENTLDIREISYTPNILNEYCVKEIKSDNMGRFDTDRIITSEMLFDSPNDS